MGDSCLRSMKLLLLLLVGLGLLPLITECATSRFKRWSASPGCSSCSSSYSYSVPSYSPSSSCSYCGSSSYVATAPACGGNCYSSGGGGGHGGGGRRRGGGGRGKSYNQGRRAGKRARKRLGKFKSKVVGFLNGITSGGGGGCRSGRCGRCGSG